MLMAVGKKVQRSGHETFFIPEPGRNPRLFALLSIYFIRILLYSTHPFSLFDTCAQGQVFIIIIVYLCPFPSSDSTLYNAKVHAIFVYTLYLDK